MTDASSLHCPNCGAAAEPGGGRCPYCHARLTAVSCPSCFAPMFNGTAFCAKCGARRARLEADDSQAECPGCRQSLSRVEIGSTTVFECAGCDGVWIDAEVFERLVRERDLQSTAMVKFPARPPATSAASIRYRPCPRCGKMMNRVNFGRVSGTVVDVCRGHGTFLDTGELHQIAAFIQAGGLERARQRQIEDLQEERQRLGAQQTKFNRERGDERFTSGGGFGEGALEALLAMLRG
jgi:Zn-finger nucleic acid-binding protein